MATQLFTDVLVVIECGECGVTFGMTQNFIDARKEDHRTWHCPNGHSRYYAQQTEKDKLAAELKRTKDTLAWERSRKDQAEAEAKHQERRVRGYQGALAKTKRRVGRGQCPNCSRTFKDLETHMAQQHPDWAPEKHAEALAE